MSKVEFQSFVNSNQGNRKKQLSRILKENPGKKLSKASQIEEIGDKQNSEKPIKSEFPLWPSVLYSPKEFSKLVEA